MRYLLGHVLTKTNKAVKVTVIEYEGEGQRIKKGVGEIVWLPFYAIKAIDKIEYYEDVEFEVEKRMMEDKNLI